MTDMRILLEEASDFLTIRGKKNHYGYFDELWTLQWVGAGGHYSLHYDVTIDDLFMTYNEELDGIGFKCLYSQNFNTYEDVINLIISTIPDRYIEPSRIIAN